MEKTSYKLNGKALYSPKGAAAEYAAVGCNIYTGCPNDCEYCYLKRGVLSHAMGGTDVKLKSCFKDEENALEIFEKELTAHVDYLRSVGIFFSFSTDPCLSETFELTSKAAMLAIKNGVPVKLLTKNADFINHPVYPILESQSKPISNNGKAMLAVGFTLTGRDDMEPHASTNEERIKTMQYIHSVGIKTFASIEPIIDFNSSFKMIEQTAKFCDLYKIGLRSGVKKGYYDQLECSYFIGKVTGLSEKIGFNVYWKESIRKFAERNSFADFMLVNNNFVNSDYNIFAE